VRNDSLRKQVYRHIREKLASGHLHAGSVISEMSLAKELGISRTPVREAIRQLQSEGLVKQVPRYGTVIRTPRRAEITELFQYREALETYAIGLATDQLSPADLRMLDKLCEQIQEIGEELRRSGCCSLDEDMLRRFLAADMAFHAILLRAAGNGRIMKSVDDLRVLTRIFSAARHVHNQELVERTYQMHREIVEALQNGDREAARQAMARHIRSSLEYTLDHYERMQEEADRRPSMMDLGLPPEVIESLKSIEEQFHGKTAEAEIAVR